jgi:ABC-type transport system substrate-binding protein
VGSGWYYVNLDDSDRENIRKAMDYAIPRQQIIDGLYQGLAVPLATEVGENVLGYDDSVQAREYNLARARLLLTKVFGKSYNNDQGVEPSDNITITPYFRMTLVSPTIGLLRPSYASLIARSFTDIGIDVELKWWNWNIIMPRIYLDPVAAGYDYAHGGVDAWFSDKNTNTDPDYSKYYFKSNFAPMGENAVWIDNQGVTEIINRSITHPNPEERLVALKEFQHWSYENVPKSFICQVIDVFVMDEDLKGFDTYLVGRGWCFNNWTIGSQTTMTYTVPGDFYSFNPLITDNYYDSIIVRNVFGALGQPRGSYNLTHIVPQIAKSWTSHENGNTWEVKIRPNLKFSDGTNLTAEDVLFTYHSVLDDYLASPYMGFFQDRFPNKASDIYLKDETNDTIIFKLRNYYPYVESQIFTLPILQKAQWMNITYSDWKNNDLSWGVKDNFPIGCGPYMMTDYDSPEGVTLEINPHFDENFFGHDPNAVDGGIFYTNPSFEVVHVKIVKEATTAVTSLSSGDYDVLDAHTGFQARLEELSSSGNQFHSKCETALEYGWQELSYNHCDPRWGMNPRVPYDDDCCHGYDYSFEILLFTALLLFIPLIIFILISIYGIWMIVYNIFTNIQKKKSL